jgi:hypothetical protein
MCASHDPQRNNWTVPTTLKGVAEFARMANGTEGLHGVCMPWCEPALYLGYLYKVFMAHYVQTSGPSSGYFFDAETLDQSIVDNEASAEVLDIMRTLWAFSPPNKFKCGMYDVDFAQGRCALAFQFSPQFKVCSSAISNSTLCVTKGDVDTWPVPGSANVLDPATKRLVPCTTQTCRGAALLQAARGESGELINHAHFFIMSLAVLNKQSPSSMQMGAYSFLTDVFGLRYVEEVLSPTVLGAAPLRLSQLDMQLWLDAGYDLHDTKSFLDTYR